MTIAQVFHALGDPVRLEIVQRLVRRQPCTIAAVTDDLGITRQGARKHLQVLADARLVVLEPVGREVHVRLDSERIGHARAFFERIEKRWDRRLEALKRALEK